VCFTRIGILFFFAHFFAIRAVNMMHVYVSLC
jgi:hypothetical protein